MPEIPAAYRAVRALVRLLLGVFYRRVEASGLERVPATGPVILAANHRNALVDPMILMAVVPRRLRPVAKAPLFRYPLIGPLLRAAGAIPVHRRQDPGSDPGQNVGMFRVSAAALAAGEVILIFPEGVSQPEPGLMPLRTGVARMLLAAESDGRPVALVPVGLVLHQPGTFRAGWALAAIGAPVQTADLAALHRAEPEPAVRALTDRLAAALRALIVETDDRKMERLLGVAERIWRQESGARGEPAAARAAWRARAIVAYRAALAREPSRVERLVGEVERYAGDLERSGLTGWELQGRYPPSAVWRFVVREGTALLLGLPLALWGLLSHVVPYQLTALAARLARPTADVEATSKLLAAVLLYPLLWGLEAWAAWRLVGAVGLGLFVTLLVPTGVLALTWWERLARARREVRGFLQFVLDRDLRRHLRERRRALMLELAALGGSEPGPDAEGA